MAAETIIESFCERCGTRSTFEPVRKREGKLVGLGKSLGILLEAPVSGSAPRDPFQGTFHFCLECRQYICPICWNEPAGFCQGCVPLPDAPDTAALEAAEEEASLEATSWMDDELAQHAALDHPEAWPDADLHRRRLQALEQTPIEPVEAPVDDLLPEDERRSLAFEVVESADTETVALAADALEAVVIETEPADTIELMADPLPDAPEPRAFDTQPTDEPSPPVVETVDTGRVAMVAPAAPMDDREADWADLLSQLPALANEDIAVDDWSAMAPALGPDIAPTPAPVAAAVLPTATPARMPAAAPQPAWRLTAPTPDAEFRQTPWPPLGPVLRPSAPSAPAQPSAHPSVLVPRPAAHGVLARGAQRGAPAPLPNGVRPCVSCELPLSASARFCRRCGRSQG